MMSRPTPYEHPGRRSHIRQVPAGPISSPVTLTPLGTDQVTGTIGRLPLTVSVYEQLDLVDECEPIARVRFHGRDEVLGTKDDVIVRSVQTATGLPHLLLSGCAR